LSAGSSFVVQINGGASFDSLDVAGTVSLGGATLTASLGAGFTPSAGQTFTIINNDGTDMVIGTFAGLAQGATVVIGGRPFTTSYTGGTGNDVVLTAQGAVTRTWDGGGADDNWTTAANWVGDFAPAPGDDLVFTGTLRLTPNNDFPANTPFRSITFNAGGFN